MAVKRDDLVAAFWARVPKTVGQATDLWLAVEDGQRDKLLVLRRLLHTIKGEAQMLGIDDAGSLLELLEEVVDRLSKTDAPVGNDVGDAVLGAVEGLGLLESSRGSGENFDPSEILNPLRALAELPPLEATGPLDALPSEPNVPTPESPHDEVEKGASAETLALARALDPTVVELRRLHGEQALLPPELREINRLVRALRAEIDPTLSAHALKERIVKTLGLGAEIERRIGDLRTSWLANEFAAHMALDQLETTVAQTTRVSTEGLATQVHRVARTTAQGLGKKVHVTVTGQAFMGAAVERHVEQSLLHLVRNAVDHGIEPPAERVGAGKPPEGSVSVSFNTHEETLEVVVEDDGRGIDFDSVRASATQIDQRYATHSNENLLPLLFNHGFTTRDEATAISGRGVGLDVVARELRIVGGHVDVKSTQGHGTRFQLQLPLSLRADMVIPVHAEQSRLALPSRVVQRIDRLERIEETPTGPRALLGDDLVPVRSLSGLLFGRGAPNLGDVIAVLEHRHQRLALTIDGYENPRATTFERSEELAFDSKLVRGAAPLADGDVLLLLDVDSLMEHARQHAASGPLGRGAASPHSRGRRCPGGERDPVRRASLFWLSCKRIDGRPRRLAQSNSRSTGFDPHRY